MSTARRNPVGTSDPISRACTCDDNPLHTGCVILFYRYVSLARPGDTAQKIQTFGATHAPNFTGKIRIAHEGINASVAASSRDVMDAFIDFMVSDCPELGVPGVEDAEAFYKPEHACAHVFPNLSVRCVDELCPFGERELKVSVSSSAKEGPLIESLSAEAWHKALLEREPNESLVLDVRNFYESRVGAFEGATLAPIRRFSQLKEWLQVHEDALREKMGKKDVYIYCTGGVRCEKAAAYMATRLPKDMQPRKICKLEGGIVSYSKHIDKGEGLFKGVNYVFDARGTVQVGPEDQVPSTSWCDGCGASSTRLGKCAGRLCHYVLVVCDACTRDEDGKTFCCDGCREQTISASGNKKFKRRPCDCDCFASRERRCQLYKDPNRAN